ncbi:MAG: chorismate mutase [Sphingomonadales bacterium]
MSALQVNALASIDSIWSKRPLIISGPCSAETPLQVTETALRLKDTGKVDILRAGIWKPRTKPGQFEGVGKKGLSWLQEARSMTGLPVMVEVATGKQVEEALASQIDILWIGARTTVNPFSVQEVADALKGVSVPVFIKNPINPDLELWVGAVERIERAGIGKIGLIHRGFSTFAQTPYRNAPLWHLAIEMKLRFPNLLFINDPSHICGRRELLSEVMQRAIDLDVDGLMVESHIHPDEAWSDAAQQVTPEALDQLLSALVWRNEDSASVAYHSALDQLRQQINQLDEEVLQLLARRMQLAEQIALYKKENNITILQAGRWQEIMERTLGRAETLQLSRTFITQYLDAIHMESISHQQKILDAGGHEKKSDRDQ